jgi:hypothetical protein
VLSHSDVVEISRKLLPNEFLQGELTSQANPDSALPPRPRTVTGRIDIVSESKTDVVQIFGKNRDAIAIRDRNGRMPRVLSWHDKRPTPSQLCSAYDGVGEVGSWV